MYFQEAPYYIVPYKPIQHKLKVLLKYIELEKWLIIRLSYTAVADKWKTCNGSLSGSISKFSLFTSFFVLPTSNSKQTFFEPSHIKITIPNMTNTTIPLWLANVNEYRKFLSMSK